MPQVYNITQQVPPASSTDTTQKQQRGTRYGDTWVSPIGEPTMLASEGTYFTSTNATWSTALTLSAAARTTFLATEALALWRNTSGSSTGVTVYPHFIQLSIVGTSTTATSIQFGLILDPANRFSSGGTLLTNNNTNSGSAVAAVSDIRVGNVTAAAASAPRQIARWTAKTAAAPCLAVGDVLTIVFGHYGAVGPGSISGVTAGTAASSMVFNVPPVAIGPSANHSLLLHYWAPAQTAAPTAECTFGWWER